MAGTSHYELIVTWHSDCDKGEKYLRFSHLSLEISNNAGPVITTLCKWNWDSTV